MTLTYLLGTILAVLVLYTTGTTIAMTKREGGTITDRHRVINLKGDANDEYTG